MIIAIEIRSVYGRDAAYPKNDAAQHLAAIADTKTLTLHALSHALGMGMSIQILDRFGNVSRTIEPANNHRRHCDELAPLLAA